MKRLMFFIAFASLLVLSFGVAQAQTSFSLDHVDGEWTPTQLQTGVPITFYLRMTNIGCGAMGGHTSGFRVYSPDGAVWTPVTYDWTDQALMSTWYDGPNTMAGFGITGSGADTVGTGGAKLFASGIPDGTDQVVYEITTMVDAAQNGLTLCIDSSWFPPGGTFLWSTVDCHGVTPDWDGPHCYELYEVPDLPPTITNCPAVEQSFDHCNAVTYDFDAEDAEGSPYTFVQTAGPGVTDAGSGMWTYSATLADVGTNPTVTVNAVDGLTGADGASCDLNLAFTNTAPSFACAAGDTKVGKGNSVSVAVDASSNDCDPISYSLGAVSPAAVGAISVDPNTGEVTFDTDVADAATEDVLFTIEVIVTDGNMSASCNVLIDVLSVEPFEVQIQKTHGTLQGGHELVNITLNKGSVAMGGFDFLIGYDASALSFQTAIAGDIPSACGWEYFTYRYSHAGNCGNQCPSGQVRVVAIAETNNGANHPSCFAGTAGDTLLTLDFLVSSDYTLECQYVPIRFVWYDCADNTISSQSGDSLFISRSVIDFDLIGDISNTAGDSYPTYTGAGASCMNGDKVTPVRFVDYLNGGIDIACIKDIDARGDVNLNGVLNEVADAVVFSNYFVYGLNAFNTSIPGQIAATDVNADGLTLSVADLVYLIRIVIGDANPFNNGNGKLNPVSASYTVGDAISVDAEMGAVAIVANGSVAPQLLADGMEMNFNYDAAENVTRILVYSLEGNSFSGSFISGVNDIQSIEFASDEGAQVVTRKIPTNFTLNQNYPNPFNPSTTISASLPQASNYSLTIYNVTGQKVAEFAGYQEAGTFSIEWDASNVASGIYFYKLATDNNTATKKMVLLK